MTNEITQLIADRKARLVYFIFGQTADLFAGKRKMLANVDEAKEYNQETDDELISRYEALPF